MDRRGGLGFLGSVLQGALPGKLVRAEVKVSTVNEGGDEQLTISACSTSWLS